MPTLAKIKAMTDEEVEQALLKAVQPVQMFAVVKGGYYYRPNSCGYTDSIEAAGRYTEEAARKELVRGESMDIVPIPAPRFTKSLDALQPIKEGLTPEQKKAFALTIYQLSSCGPLWDDDGFAQWNNIGIFMSVPASIQSRALLAAVRE